MQHSELASELDSLSSVFQDLGQRISDTVARMRQAGQPPAEDTITLLQTARRRFLDVRDAALQKATDERLSAVPGPEELASLPELQKLLAAIADACAQRERQEQQRQRLRAAGDVLDRVLQVVHKNGIEYLPLSECQAKARALREAADAGPDDAQLAELTAAAEGRHPFCDWLALVSKADDIDDERWEQLEDSVKRAFGKSLTTATTRGKLVLPGVTPPEPPRPPARQPAMTMLSIDSEEVGLGDVVATSHRASPTLIDFTLSGDGRSPPHEPGQDDRRRPWPEDPWVRSPLAAWQESALLAPVSGVAILFGSRIAGLEDVERFLEVACENGRLLTVNAATDRSGFLRELDGLLKDRPDGTLLVVVPSVCTWSEDWILRSLELIRRRSVPQKVTRVLFIADPEGAWSWMRLEADLRSKLLQDGVIEYSLQPWTDAEVGNWLQDLDLMDCDPYIRERFTRLTANWGDLLRRLGERFKENPRLWQEHLSEFERELTQNTDWEERLGLVAQAQAVLKVMAQLTQPVRVEAICARMPGTPRERIDMVLRWADLLSYIHCAERDQWSLNPLLRQVVLQGAAKR